VVLRLVGATLLLASAVPAAVFAAHDVHTVTELTTTPGAVTDGTDDAGNPATVVRYYDDLIGSENTRPLTPAERARGANVGDTIDVTYVPYDATIGHGHDLILVEWAVLATLAAVLLLKRALLWPRRLRRAQEAAPYPVDVTGWVRVVRRRPWLVIPAQ